MAPRSRPSASASACTGRCPWRKRPACRPCRRRRGRSPVAGVAGPAPVVGLAAEVRRCPRPARRRGGRRLISSCAISKYFGALEERRDAAAQPVLLAGRDALLDPPLDDVETLAVGQPRVDVPGDLVGDLVDRDRHETREPGPIHSSSSRVFARKPSSIEVPLRRGVVLEGALDAVVVRDDQAVGRDERRAAARRARRRPPSAGRSGRRRPSGRRGSPALEAGGELGICWGIHIPSSACAAKATTRKARRA